MLGVLLRAFAELFSPPLRAVVGISLGIAVLAFTVLWLAVALILAHTALVGWPALDWVVELSGAVGVLLLSWLLFPAVVTMVMGFFLERVAGAVEAARLSRPRTGAANGDSPKRWRSAFG